MNVEPYASEGIVYFLAYKWRRSFSSHFGLVKTNTSLDIITIYSTLNIELVSHSADVLLNDMSNLYVKQTFSHKYGRNYLGYFECDAH